MGNRRVCEKCGIMHFCDDHHILPESIFGKGETAALCKNCHDEYHRYLGFSYLRKKNAQPKEFYISKWAKWISGFTFLLSIGYIFLYLNK